MTTLGARQYPGTNLGRGHQTSRNGVPTPLHYDLPVGRRLVNAGTSTTGWSAASGCTMDTASVTNPEGNAQTLVRFTGTGDNVTAFIDCTSAPFTGAQIGKDGIEFDLYYATGEPFSDLGSAGNAFRAIFTDAGGTNSVSCNTTIRQGWQRLRMRKAEFNSVSGTGNWDTTNFSSLRLRIGARSGVTHIVQIRNAGHMGQSRPKLCIQFDDIGESVYTTAFPLMQARGIPGSCGVISDGIGQDAWNGYNRLTVAEMAEMKRAGWDFFNHTKTHTTGLAATRTQGDWETEIQTCRDAILSNGLGNGISEHLFAAPGGEFSSAYWAAAAASGCKQFRGLTGSDTTLATPIAESDVTFSPLVQSAAAVPINTTPAATILSYIDSLIGKGGQLTITFHHIVTTPGSSIEYSTANFTTVLDGIVSRMANLDLVNSSQMYEATRL